MVSQPIPRASTCPTLGSGGNSPRAAGLRALQTAWRRPGAAGAGAGGVDASTAGFAARLTGRGLLLATLALYTAAVLGLPLLYSRFGPHRLGSSLEAATGGGSGSDLQATALAEGVLRPDQPDQQQQQQQQQQQHQQHLVQPIQQSRLAAALSNRRLAAALSNRRMALQQAAATGELWPGASLALPLPTAARPQQPRVEYRDAGNVVGLVDALNSSCWDELQLYRAEPLPGSAPSRADGSGAGTSAPGSRPLAPGSTGAGGVLPPHFLVQCPQGEVRLFIGIASRCCTEEAQAKRREIRRTWVQYARDHFPEIAIRFILAQPSTDAELRAAVELLGGEIQRHADIIIVPGTDVYRNLPSKTLQMLHYVLSSECKYTHVVKADDDVYLRPQMLMEIIQSGHYNFSVEVQYDGSGGFDGRPASYHQAPWMSSMYVGQLDSSKPGGVYPGWSPNGDPRSKWYLSEEDLPTEFAPLGVRWASGWGYMLSRDLAEFIANTALMYAAVPEKKPLWWGRMPWEDIMVGAMLNGVARVHHHDGFKAAWQECDRLTVLKHLDNDAPSLQEGLFVQEISGLWSKKSVVCSSGIFEVNNHSDWRLWRNSLPDNQIGGFM